MVGPKVSVAMTTYNALPHVVEAVQAILKQTMPDFELIIVDDGSTDGTIEAIQAMKDPRIHLVQIPRCGRIPSLNHAFRLARAPFVAVQDADDVSLPARLESQLAAMRMPSRLAVLGAGVVPQIDENGGSLDTRSRPVGKAAARRALGHSMAFFHSSVMYRKSAWESVGGFDEVLPCWEDYDMCVKLAANWEVDNLPMSLGLKRRHAHQAFDAIHFTRRGYRARAKILLRYFRRVRHDPVVLARAAAFMLMSPRLRLLWLKATRRDAAEVRLHSTIRG